MTTATYFYASNVLRMNDFKTRKVFIEYNGINSIRLWLWYLRVVRCDSDNEGSTFTDRSAMFL